LVLYDVLEEKQEENSLSQPVRRKGITGCESFSGTNAEQADLFLRFEGRTEGGQGGFWGK
jgi:hypothetical protein